ncbi:MAG: glycosyltransferase family 2 protein [Microbacteriaceae bacterium]|nr:glycosyltransferase family 2 protein [Microbacteriaceae bacterium]MCL2795517.1 glycosyltransferase family 2 protein [Microbacteriaceae bacterium]
MGRWGLQRWIGIVVLVIVAVAGGLIWLAVSMQRLRLAPPQEGILFNTWHFLFNSTVPTPWLLLLGVAAILLIAAAVALVEFRTASRDRRSLDAKHLPLSPRVVMGETRGVYAGPVTITVLVPAHNEEASLPGTLRSLWTQSRPPDRIIVVADNCTDRTPELAVEGGAEVFVTVDNDKKKAGGLNQVLKRVLPGQGDNDTLMIMDADTELDDGFLAEAERRFTEDRGLMAVGGLFYGEEGHGLIGQCQRNEYVRYSRDLKRRRGQVFVLTGTASLFRPRALRTVAESRGTRIPGITGDVYDTLALTEDNELTIALKSLGALMISPAGCTVVTELMPSWKTLWNQRMRWQRGALENIGAYSVTRETFRYWSQQIGIGYGVVALFGYFAAMFVLIVAADRWIWFPFWLGIGLVFMLERVVTVWKGGWRARLLAVTLFPELFFAAFLDLVYVKSIIDITTGRKAQWTHVEHPTGPMARGADAGRAGPAAGGR